jgi:hypothetical protein
MFNPLTILPNDASANTNVDVVMTIVKSKLDATVPIIIILMTKIANNVFQHQHSTDDLEILLTNQNEPNQ